MNPYQPLVRPRRPWTVTAAMIAPWPMAVMFLIAHSFLSPNREPGEGPLALIAANLLGGLYVLLLLYLAYAVRGLSRGEARVRNATMILVPALAVLMTAATVCLLVTLHLPTRAAAVMTVAVALGVPSALLTTILLGVRPSAAFFAGPPR